MPRLSSARPVPARPAVPRRRGGWGGRVEGVASRLLSGLGKLDPELLGLVAGGGELLLDRLGALRHGARDRHQSGDAILSAFPGFQPVGARGEVRAIALRVGALRLDDRGEALDLLGRAAKSAGSTPVRMALPTGRPTSFLILSASFWVSLMPSAVALRTAFAAGEPSSAIKACTRA